MKWLRFTNGQYINSGIVPANGFRVVTTIRMGFVYNNMPIFGSRNTTSADASSFNLFWLSDFDMGIMDFRGRFRVDYGSAGNDTVFEQDNYASTNLKRVYTIDFSQTTTINGIPSTAGTSVSGNTRPIYIGNLNNNNAAYTPVYQGDISEFIIYNASGVEVFHGMPVPTGDTTYSGTPAPGNCYWDLVSGTYKQKSSGTNNIGYDDDDDDDDDELSESNEALIPGADYGFKVLAEDDQSMAYMNSKYPLFGADISSQTSQFKTYTFTLTGFNSEPAPAYPAYVYDSNFYYGHGNVERTAQTIDTGFSGGKIKSVLIQHSGVLNANYFARARQFTTYSGDGTNINTLINPSTKSAPGLVNVQQSNLGVVGSTMEDTNVLSGQPGTATFSTLYGFNGGTVYSDLLDSPYVKVSIDTDGILRLKTIVPYEWIQRAYTSGGNTYRARWCDWGWYQGVTVTVTVLNTPYTL